MFFKTETVFKAYATETAAAKYLARHFANGGAEIKKVGNLFMVVAA